ncbi:hypothetical protein FRC06_009716, partial [Ceratobasidium sp. 370]
MAREAHLLPLQIVFAPQSPLPSSSQMDRQHRIDARHASSAAAASYTEVLDSIAPESIACKQELEDESGQVELDLPKSQP